MPKEDAEPPRCAVCGLQRAPNAVLLPFPDRRQSKLYNAWLDFVRGCPGKGNWLPDSRTGFVCTLHFTCRWLRRTTGSAYHNNSLLLRTATVPTLYTSPEKRRRIAEANSSSATAAQAVQGPNLRSISLASTNTKHHQLLDMHDTNQLPVDTGQGCSRAWDRKPDNCLTVGGHSASSVDLPVPHLKPKESNCIALDSGSTSSTSITVVAKARSDPKKTVSSTESLSTHSLPDTGRVPVYASVRRPIGPRRTLSEDTDATAGASTQSTGAKVLERPGLGVLTRFAQKLVKNVKDSEQQESSTGLAARRDDSVRDLDAEGEDFTAASYRIWSEEETKLLLDFYTTYTRQVGPHDRFKTKKIMYEEIAREMSRVLNVQRTAAQCRSRMSTMRKQRMKADKNYEASGDFGCSAPCEAETAVNDVLVPEVILECEK